MAACEQSVPGRGRDVSGGHRCTRAARWTVTTPTGESLNVCTAHRTQIERLWYGQPIAVKEA